MPRNDLKAYTSVIARIPQDLADQVKRYAREHRCTISELIRDGLEMRLDTDLPWHAPGDRHGAESEVLPEVLPGLDALTPMLYTLVRETVRATMSEVLQEVLHGETGRQAVIPEVLHEVLPDSVEVIPEGLPSRDQVLHGHTSTLQAPPASPSEGMTSVIPGHAEVIPARSTGRSARRGMTEVLPFDPVKYRLGKLCPRGHDYQGTGQSLRVNNKAGYCLACNAAANQRKRAQQRQEASA